MFRFTDTTAHHFRRGMLYLGRDLDTGAHIGMRTEKGAITVGSARTGKGAAQIIPNLLLWPGNSLTIDPSGENAAATWDKLEGRGVKVIVLDPFQEAQIPARLRASCNLLNAINPDSLTIREDVRVIADGLTMRNNPDHNDWADKRLEVIAGTIAHIVTSAPPKFRTLLDVSAVLNLPPIPQQNIKISQLEAFLTSMCENHAAAGLAKKGGTTALNSFKATNKQGPEGAALGGAQSELDWINSRGMADILGGRGFDLSELKTGNVAMFLVLPPDYLDEHGRFLRLFVRCALSAMMKGGKVGEINPNGKINRPCLFLLDEFFSLGHLGIVQKAAGLLPKNGVHLWPFLQDIGQLLQLYGENGAETFFANADAQIFFGLGGDNKTSEWVSRKLGNLTPDEVAPPFEPLPPVMRRHISVTDGTYHRHSTRYDLPPIEWQVLQSVDLGKPDIWGARPQPIEKREMQKFYRQETIEETAKRIAHEDETKAQAQMHHEARLRAQYDHAMRKVGTPRLDAGQLAQLVGKGDGDKVARSMIVFGKAGAVFNLALTPYFEIVGPAGALPASRSLASSSV